MVGNAGGNHLLPEWEKALEYIEAHTEIRDVLLSGGDPLVDRRRQARTSAGPPALHRHVEFVRIGTKIPVVLPQRVTPTWCGLLKHHPLWMSLHFTHPAGSRP